METNQILNQVNELMAGHPKVATELYDHIELSKEEIDAVTTEALRQARKAKHFQLAQKSYWEKVNKPVEYPRLDKKLTLQVFLAYVRRINPKFQMTEFNKNIIDQLCLYFAEDPEFEKDGLSLSKGIMLVGPVGCGKTTIMKAFAINSTNPFAVVAARKISSDFTDKEKGGDYTINKFSNIFRAIPQQNYGFSGIGLCIDDLGTESVKKHFGNEADVVSEVIFNRYDRGLKTFTHFTANISSDQIEEAYGVRIKSRLREMCNYLAFDIESPDHRI